MSLYSQNVSNNPLSLDGLIVGNFDEVYVDGQPIIPTDTSGLVPYTGATTTVNLNSKKITTTYTATNPEDLTNKSFTDGTYLPKAGFNLTSGTFTFNTGTTVNLTGSIYYNPTPASFVGVLCLDATNKVVQKLTTIIGDANLGATQTFLGYNTFSLPLTTNGIGNTGDISTTALLTCANLEITGSSIATPVYTLGINGSNRVVRFAGGTGDAVLSAGTLGLPQQFTGYNYFANLLKLNGSIQFTNPVTAGTPTYILGVDSATGNLVSTAPTSAPSQLTITNTAVSNTYYPTWITSTSTGVKTIYGVNGVSYDLPAGLLTATKLKLGMPLPTGTTSSILAVDATGNVISGTVTSAPSQISPTPINTSIVLYPAFLNSTAGGATTTYVESDGSLFYNPFNNNLTVGSGAIICNTLQPQAGNSLVINAIGNGQMLLQSASATVARLDGLGLYVNDIQTTNTINDMNIYASTTTNVNLWSGGANRFSATPEGTWMPVSASKSFYITDTIPRTATTTYYRLFGLGGTVYNDFCNTVMWRALNLAGTAGPNAMYLRSTGLNIPLSTATHPTLNDYELVVGDNSASTNTSAKILIRGNTTTNLKGPSIDFTAYNSHTSAQGSIEVIDGGLWDGVLQFWLKQRGAGAGAAMTQVFKQTTDGFHFYTLPQGNTSGCIYSYASQGLPNLFRLVQNQNWFFYYGGQWSVGRFLGYFDKQHDGSIVKFNAVATQYTSGVGTILCQIAIRHTGLNLWYYYSQGTFFNYTNGHFVTPNIDTGYGLYAGQYEVWVNGSGITDGNDVMRLHVTIAPT